MARAAIFLMISCGLVLGLEAYCFYLGQEYKLGDKFELGGCLKCECLKSRRVKCDIDCPPVQCEDGVEPETVYGDCCPSCPGPQPTFEDPVDSTPESAIM